MTYIPKETQEKIDHLNQQLVETEERRNQAEQQITKNKSRMMAFQTGFYVSLVLLIAILVFGYWQYSNGQLVLDGQVVNRATLQSDIDSLQNALMMTEQQAAQQGAEIDFSNGLWYFVQIGAYEERDLSMFEENMFNFRQREEDGLYKYTLGAFRDLERAETFMQNVRAMGISDAWLLAINDGERLTIEASRSINQ